jgi:sugar fermentation stimulation protein A
MHRRTAYDLLLVANAGVLVSVDARLPNRLFAEAVAAGRLAPFAETASLESEVRHGGSRLDFRLQSAAGPCWVETKSVTLVEEGLALFPDAPTARGRRHLRELTAIARRGEHTAVVFVIQRPDATAFAPHIAADPAFGQALAEATAAGVKAHAFRCAVTLEEIRITDEVAVRLPGSSA